MPRLSQSFPRYRKHRASGQAVVTLGGKDHYLGPHGTQASKAFYDRLIAEWLVGGRTVQDSDQQDYRLVELIAAYRRFARRYYRKNGKVTREAHLIDEAAKHAKRLYSRTPAAEFGPKRLKAVRQSMIDAGWSRKYINKQVGRIRRMFRWGVKEELVPASVYSALGQVRDLRQGRTTVRETKPVEPASESAVQATLPRLPAVVADMVRLQKLTGMRPEEVCLLRPGDLDRSGDVWLYAPESHKTEHHGRGRVVAIGPQGQAILRPYLLRPADVYCFSPVESEAKRRQQQHQARQTPLSCGNRPGSNRKSKPKTKAGQRYTRDSYRRAVHRAIEAENAQRQKDGRKEMLEKWSPNRLRHSAATEIRLLVG